MRVAHVVASIDDPNAGPSHSVSRLCEALSNRDFAVDLHTVKGWRHGPPTEFPAVHRHQQTLAKVPVLNRLCLSSDLQHVLKRDASALDVIHSHGLWLMPNIYPSWAVKDGKPATVISPRGMFGAAALGFSSQKKALFWSLLQKRAVESTDCLHATSQSELDEVRAFGILRPVAIISNGVDIDPLLPKPQSPVRTLLTLGRIHPKKGLRDLVLAWSRLEALFPDWRLRIVGPSELGHAEELERLVLDLELKHVLIEGPLGGKAKAAAYRQADLFVLPTLNENFALTVAESLAAGTPVISTKGAPWAGLEPRGCGWWIDHGVDSLSFRLTEAMSLPRDVLDNMGLRGRAWMRDEFSWARVAGQMTELYAWLCGKGPVPPFVAIN